VSFVSAGPEAMAAAATDLANIGSTVREANAAAAALITGLAPAAEDEVSTAIAGLFGKYANEFQSLGAQAAAFHDRLVQNLNAAAGTYAATEAASASVLQTAEQNLVNAVNAPAELLLGHPLIGTGTTMSAGTALEAVIAAPLTAVGTTLVMGGSGDPFPTSTFQNAVNNLFIQITPGLEGSVPKGVFTPEQFYPFGGPNELTLAASVSQGVQLLDNALQPYIAAGTPVGVFGYSQSAVIASLEMRSLEAAGVPSSAVHFELIGDLMNPNGGYFERYVGLNLAALGINFSGATPSNAYPTTIYTMEYDGWADVPRYPLDILSDLNTLQSQTHFAYPNLTPAQVGSAIQLATSGATQTTYYMIPTHDLPLLDPIRGGIPIFGNAIADLLQPDLTYLVNLGYGDPLYGWSTSPANIPTPVGLLPSLSAFQELPGLLTSGTQLGVHNFIGDLTGTGPNPVVLPSLGSVSSLLTSSSGTASMTSALTNPVMTLASVAADPAALESAIPNLLNTIPNYLNTLGAGLSNVYGAILPTLDIANAAVLSVPAFDITLFTAGIQQAIDGQPLAGFVNAIAMPIAADIAIYLLLGQFELGVLAVAGFPVP
jgi:hypothetical protein